MEIHIAALDHPVEESKPTPAPSQPHDSLFLVLAYLPLLELLVMSKVCKVFKEAVNQDVLLWLNIKVETPLNWRISDRILADICSRASGRLHSLILSNCFGITDNGLLRVIQRNPLIQKLHLPGCIGLTPEGVITTVQTLTQHPNHKLSSLKIDGICNLKPEHLQTLRVCLNVNHTQQQQQRRRRLYHHRRRNNSEHRDACFPIDVEECPQCDEVRLVFDCPTETCRTKIMHSWSRCRGCIYCVPRCEECGACVEFREQGDAVCAEILCLNCWFQLPKCNFCNKPYCRHHADLQCPTAEVTGFVCGVCQDKFCYQKIVLEHRNDCKE